MSKRKKSSTPGSTEEIDLSTTTYQQGRGRFLDGRDAGTGNGHRKARSIGESQFSGSLLPVIALGGTKAARKERRWGPGSRISAMPFWGALEGRGKTMRNERHSDPATA